MGKNTQEKNAIQTDLNSWVGCSCEVLSLENQLLMVGFFSRYTAENHEVFVELYNNDTIPARPRNFGDSVKIQLHHLNKDGSVQVFMGAISGSTDKVWRIRLEKEVMRTETRQTFRQRANCGAMIARVWTEQFHGASHLCELVDISLGGLCFHSNLKYIIRERLVLSEIQLLPEGRTYTFNCIVRRIQEDVDNPEFHLYGCQFIGLSDEDESDLCQDIFTLQSQELSRWRNTK